MIGKKQAWRLTIYDNDLWGKDKCLSQKEKFQSEDLALLRKAEELQKKTFDNKG